MKVILLASVLLLPWLQLRAQQSDTTSIRSFDLNEVRINQDNRGAGKAGASKQKDLMQLTDHILEATPGISMIRRGNFAMEPALRGLNNAQVTMSIDGIRIFGACTDRMDPVSSYLEPNNMESFVISWQPGAAGMGSSIGGGIDFKLRKPLFSSLPAHKAHFGSGFESNGNAFQTLAAFGYGSPKFAIQGNVIYRRSENYRSGNGRTVAFSQYRKWNANISARYRTGDSSFIGLDYLQDEGYDIGYPALTMDVKFAKAKIAAISYTLQKHGLKWENKLYFNYIDHAMDDTKRPPETVPIHMDMPGTSQTSGAYSALTGRLGKRHLFRLQADGFYNYLSAEMTMYPDNSSPMFMYTLPTPARSSLALSLTDTYELTDILNLTGTVRVEYNHDKVVSDAGRAQLSGMYTGDLTQSNILPNAGLTLEIAPCHLWNVRIELAHASRNASLQERYAFYIFNRPDAFDYIGAPALAPERSWNLSLTAGLHSGAFSATARAYSYFIRNYIAGQQLKGYSTMTIGAAGVKQYINLSSARISGAELLMQLSLNKRVTLSSSNTYTYGRDMQHFALPFIPPLRSDNMLSYQSRDLSLGIQSVSNFSQDHVSTFFYGELPTPASTVLNFSAGRSFDLKKQSLKLSMALNNVLNTEYVQHLDILKVPRPGRSISIRAEITF